MVLALVEPTAIRDFVEDSEAFDKAVEAWFLATDLDKDGVLSLSELRRWLEHQEIMGLPLEEAVSAEEVDGMYKDAFQTFDSDRNGVVDKVEFREQVRMILLSMADGLAGMSVSMDIGEKSLVGAVLAHKKPYFFSPMPSRPKHSLPASQKSKDHASARQAPVARPPIPRPPKASRPPKAPTMIASVG